MSAFSASQNIPGSTSDLTTSLARRLSKDGWLCAREAVVSESPLARADLLCMRRKLDEQPMMVCEIKASRADLLADLRAEKWRKYLAVAAVVFAFPRGLAQPMEIPIECGLIVRAALGGWRWERGPGLSRAPMPSAYLYRRLALTAADQAWINGRDTERGRVAEHAVEASDAAKASGGRERSDRGAEPQSDLKGVRVEIARA